MKIQTFIFVHDQNIILDFKKNNKFKSLENLKYVFLGSRDTDKIKNMEDITLKRIDTLFHTNRDKFWKEMRRIRKQNESVSVSINDLKLNFEKLFNEKKLPVH